MPTELQLATHRAKRAWGLDKRQLP